MKKTGHNGKVEADTFFLFFQGLYQLDQNGIWAIPPGP